MNTTRYCPSCGEECSWEHRFCQHCSAELPLATKGQKNPTPRPTAPQKFSQTEMGLPAGAILASRYRILRILGMGGMGSVYLAEDQKLETRVAIKVLREVLSRDTGSVKGLIAEAKHSIRLSHPNVVRVNNFEDGETVKFLVMEYVEGQSLADRIAEKEKLSEEEVRRIGIEICKGLEHAHEMKVIHRDIKPGNILMGKNGAIKIADFGIARECRDSMSRLTSQVDSGTLLYMSPEQLLGKSNEASDVYSLGVVLYEMLAGKPPFRSGDIPYQIREIVPDPPEGISPLLSGIVLKSLEKMPKARFAGARDLREELDGTAERRRQEERRRTEEDRKRQEQDSIRLGEEEEHRKRDEVTRQQQEEIRRRAAAIAAEASALLESNQYGQAEGRFQEALELDPTHAAAKHGLNRCRIAQREGAQAALTSRHRPAQNLTRYLKIATMAAVFFGGWFLINQTYKGTNPAMPRAQVPSPQSVAEALAEYSRRGTTLIVVDAPVGKWSDEIVIPTGVYFDWSESDGQFVIMDDKGSTAKWDSAKGIRERLPYPSKRVKFQSVGDKPAKVKLRLANRPF
jgi:tRNA A-37 threonylcarbamoyl transferase component Bud32